MKKRKILGIDYGDFSIGLAIFDVETDFIFPYKTIFRDKANILRKSIREIIDIIKVENITDIVIGLPLNADGTEGERVEKVKNFAKMLQNGLTNANVPVGADIIRQTSNTNVPVGADIIRQTSNTNIPVGADIIRPTNIYFQDERLTTVEAKTILAEHGIKKTDWKKTIDQIAAELILEDYKHKNKL